MSYAHGAFRDARAERRDGRERAPEEFFHQVLPAFRRWETLRTEANASIDAFHDDPDVRSAAKRYTEATVTPEFMTGAYWKRRYEKPPGYPGDFGIMNFLYNDIAVGDSIYQKLISQVGLEQPVAASVLPRMRAYGHIRDVVAGTEDRAARICSPAAVGARGRRLPPRDAPDERGRIHAD